MGAMTFLANHPGMDIFNLEWLRAHGPTIGIVLVVVIAVSWLARAAVRRMRRRLEATEGATAEINLRRAATLTQTLSNAIRIVIWTMAVFLVLGVLGLNLAPLLAGAGIAGVALGFGAQSLVRDFLSGFFIISENQFGVGDVIDVATPAGKTSGKVESITLRITSVRSFDGTHHVIPNGNILVIGNRSRGWARAIVDVQVAYGANVEEVRRTLEELFGELREDEELKGAFMDGPRVLGVEALADYWMAIRVVAETRPSRRLSTERELRMRIKQRFDERGIQIPAPPTVRRTPDREDVTTT